MIEPESLVINPELVAIVGVEAAHMLEALKGSRDIKSNAGFLGPFTLYCLIERFAIFDTTAGKFWHVGRADLGGKHDRIVINGNRQRKYASARLDN